MIGNQLAIPRKLPLRSLKKKKSMKVQRTNRSSQLSHQKLITHLRQQFSEVCHLPFKVKLLLIRSSPLNMNMAKKRLKNRIMSRVNLMRSIMELMILMIGLMRMKKLKKQRNLSVTWNRPAQCSHQLSLPTILLNSPLVIGPSSNQRENRLTLTTSTNQKRNQITKVIQVAMITKSILKSKTSILLTLSAILHLQ